MRRCTFLAMVLITGAMLLASPAMAQTRLYIPCPNGVPCGMTFPGHVDAYEGAPLPWIVSVAVPANVCFFVLIFTSDANTLVSVLRPDGIVHRGSDRASINSTPIAGWYTVQVDSQPPAVEQIFSIKLELGHAGSCIGVIGR
jgi:hypothetical protein